VSPRQYRRILGENIRTHRKNRKISQEKLAEKADLHPKYISEVERGRKTISVDALARIAEALEATVNDLTRGF
jgi:transcriptional regulator with XRE-family HTH domain